MSRNLGFCAIYLCHGDKIMLLEKDKSVVYSMCQTGMSLETLKMSFPQFDYEDIKAVYEDYKADSDFEPEDITISCNCS